MSDILIKGMEMPDKATTIVVFPEGKARVFRQDIDHDEWLTAIEVPPHGRLIDADEAISHPNMAEKNGRKLNPNYDREWFRHCVTYARLIIETSPTIIEAENGT